MNNDNKVLPEETFIQECNNIKKITKSDLEKVAKKYLNPNQAVISILLPEKKDKNLKEITNKQKKPATVIKKDETITQYKLPNNINLIINHNKLNDIVIFINIYSL